MRILIINPIVDRAWEERVRQALSGQSYPGVEIAVETVESGPDTIETAYDHTLAAASVTEFVTRRSDEINSRFDAAIINSFDGPGLYPARELLTIPVTAPGEASFMVAAGLGTAVGVITATRDNPSRAVHHMAASCHAQAAYVRTKDCGLRAGELAVIERRKVGQALVGAGRHLVSAGADVLILGCSSMTGMAAKLSGDLDVPVIDCLLAAAAWAQTFSALGMRRRSPDEPDDGR